MTKAIDAEFANSPFETTTQTESAFAANWVKQFGNIQFLIVSIGSVVFFTLLLVTGNTMAISVRERTSELAVFKAIGFSDRAVLLFVLAEALAIAVFGGLLGIVLAPSMLLFGLGLAIVVGFASGVIPGVSAMRLRVVNALRRV